MTHIVAIVVCCLGFFNKRWQAEILVVIFDKNIECKLSFVI